MAHNSGFHEVADGVWVSRHAWFDVNVTVVAGSRGLVVVDTQASDVAAREDVEDLRRALGPGRDVVAAVNTHEHFDHWFGNAAWRQAYPSCELVAHDEAATRMRASAAGPRPVDALTDEPRREEIFGSRLLPAETTFSSVHVIDLGDRAVELIHPGRGHTDGDLVVRVEAADALLAGDLVEEAPERADVPGFGADCHPLDWPLSLDLVIGLLGADSVVVPGHGRVVDRAFVEEQRASIGVVAETIRDLAGRGIPVTGALSAADWPYPAQYLEDAVRRGYADLPRAAKHLPLI